MTRSRRLSCCLSIAFAALGCGRDGSPTPPEVDGADAASAAPEYRVTLGGGAREFEVQAEGQHATLIAGPQGAYHVWISFLSYGFDEDVLRMQASTRWDDAPDTAFEMHGDVAARLVLDADGQSARVTVGWPAVVKDPLCQDGRVLRVDLTISDAEHSASDSRRWILDVAEMYRPSDCADAGAP